VDDFQINIIGDLCIVKVDILIATHRDVKTFWNEMENKSIFKQKKLIIDLSPCNYVDSTFMGIIVKLFRQVCDENGQLALVFPRMDSLESFRMMGITKIIDCHDTLDKALESFGSKPKIQNLKFDQKFSLN
jgi:anti-sigma B factor antagonist/stage II sporulation protein AA (anti-sigma F factor antagonist)